MAKKDQTTLEAEVAANGLTAAIKAKSTEVLWARFYDPNSLRPVFSGRDGVIYESFEEMSQKNEIGYDYYSSLPGSVLKTGQKKWRKMLTTKE